MATNYVLIDFENVQPKNLRLLKGKSFKILVFVGANQTKLPTNFAQEMQALGGDARYIQIAGSGRNALDFHITYYLGALVAKDAQGSFHIISKDKGFDPLVRHLRADGIKVKRETDLAEIPALRLKDTTSLDEKIDGIVRNLVGRGQSRPRKVTTLQNTIDNLFTAKLNQQELDRLIEELKRRKYIAVKQNRVTYRLPR